MRPLLLASLIALPVAARAACPDAEAERRMAGALFPVAGRSPTLPPEAGPIDAAHHAGFATQPVSVSVRTR